jgi:DNA-binding NtrC family response regulator
LQTFFARPLDTGFRRYDELLKERRKMMKRLLIVDDEPNLVDTMVQVFELKGYQVASAHTAAQAWQQLVEFQPDIVFLDIDLAGDGRDRTGGEILRQLRARWDRQELPVIVISGAGDTRLLQELLQQGADDYEVKPIEFKGLLDKVQRFLNRPSGGSQAPAEAWREELVGKSKQIMHLTLEIWRLAQLGADALILGETGTGKNLAAHMYHQFSPRSVRRFYEIDCANIAPNLFETEIFGYAQGAYTEAKRTKKGRIEEADGGIAFFNEIGDIPLEQQVKLLTLLENKVITRVGSNEPIRLDVIILAATNRDLHAMVDRGTFRPDLYYRLCHNVLSMPPLREHREDIPYLTEHFIRKYNAEYAKHITGTAPEVQDRLHALPWPGNVRQLEHCISAGVQNSLDATITLQDIQPSLDAFGRETAAAEGLDLSADYATFRNIEDGLSRDMQRKYLIHHLELNGWNIAQTARRIGIKREYLNQLMKKFAVQREK